MKYFKVRRKSKMLLCQYYRAGDAYDVHLDTIQPVERRWVWR